MLEWLILLKAVILGLVEGLTEFAPVSSTGHMIIVDDVWLKSKQLMPDEAANTFKVVIQLGSILAVVIVFKERLVELSGLSRRSKQGKGQRLGLGKVFVGLLPAGILGILLKDLIDDYLFSVETVLIGLVLGSITMLLADRYAPKKEAAISMDEMTYKQAWLVGCIQCFSLWPGFSRSGATISGGVMFGMSHRSAADFTFIMAIPIMAGASFISLLDHWHVFTLDMMPFFVVGFLSAFGFALLSIRFFLKLINRLKLKPFAIYRLILALAIYLVLFS